jgi:Na+-transporting NADH:ubiquinone oxidoreductase subunit NqrC
MRAGQSTRGSTASCCIALSLLLCSCTAALAAMQQQQQQDQQQQQQLLGAVQVTDPQLAAALADAQAAAGKPRLFHENLVTARPLVGAGGR